MFIKKNRRIIFIASFALIGIVIIGMAMWFIFGKNENEVINYQIEINSPLTPSNSEVIITYTENGITKNCSFSIVVTSTTLTGLTVENLPNKMKYKTGQIFDASGLTVIAVFNDGLYSQLVSDWTTNLDKKLLSITDTNVIISYQIIFGASVSFNF